MLAFSMNIEASGVPKYLQLYTYIKGELASGRIATGEKLPSVRSLSDMLDLSKGTIENAYAQLVLEGYIETRPRSGYYARRFDAFQPVTSEPTPACVHDPSEEAPRDGIEVAAFPFSEWKRAIGRVIDYEASALVTGGNPRGEWQLRHEIKRFVHQFRGVACSEEHIVVGAGVQYLLGLLAAIFNRDDRTLAFEFPGFSKGAYIFEDHGFIPEYIPLERDGINVELLERSEADVVYVSPSHQYPTGSVMPIDKRQMLLKWARARRGYIIEDDYDSVLRYEGAPVPALKSLEGGDRVIYVGSFSKLLLPSLRVSFMILPSDINTVFDHIAYRYSQSVSKIDQLTLAAFMREGGFERHVRRLKKRYGRKHALLSDAFKRHPNPHLSLIGNASGHYAVLMGAPGGAGTQAMDAVIDTIRACGIGLDAISGYLEDPVFGLSYGNVPDSEIEGLVATLVHLFEAAFEAERADCR